MGQAYVFIDRQFVVFAINIEVLLDIPYFKKSVNPEQLASEKPAD